MRTNLPANTAMRAPGAMNSIYFIESVMERVATELKLDPLEVECTDTLSFLYGRSLLNDRKVRSRNFYQNGQPTPYGQPVLYSEVYLGSLS